MSATQLTRAFLTGAFLVGLAGSAFALDGKDFAKTLNAAYEKYGAQIAFSRADVEGETVILRDASISGSSDKKLPMGDLTFTGVEEGGDGGYTAEALKVPDVDYRKDGRHISIRKIEIDGIEIPPVHPAKGSASTIFYKAASVGPIAISDKKGEVFSLAHIKSTLDRMDDNSGFKTSVTASGLKLHLDRTKDPKTRDAIEALGYRTVTGEIDLDASWKREGGHVEVSQLSLKLDDVGTLDFTADLTGYTPSFIESLRQLQENAIAHPDDKKTQQAYGIAMLGLMQQLSFGGASLSFEDDSITQKVLDYLGKQRGVSGDQMAAAATAMLPLALSKLKNPDFERQITDAVSKFLDDPQNIAVEASPEKPVPFPMIMGAAMAAPKTLPDVLDVTVRANQ